MVCSKYKELCYAVHHGDIEEVRRIIKSYGISHSPSWSSGYYVLCDAIRYGWKVVAKFLLLSGSRVNNKTQYYENTPLHYATRTGDSEMTEILLGYGADANIANNDGITPLFYGIRPQELLRIANYPELLEYTHISDQEDFAFEVVVMRSIRVIELLLNSGADVNAELSFGLYEGYTPLLFAVEGRCIKLVEHLINKGALIDHGSSSGQRKGYSPLLFAVCDGNVKMVELLLKYGANVHCICSSGRNKGCTPLWLAVKRGYKMIFELLAEHGADVHAPFHDYEITLHSAVANGHLELTKHAIKHGIDVNLKDTEGKTAMHLTCAKGPSSEVEIAKLLVEHGADVNAQTVMGVTPLHAACKFGSLNIVNFLLLLNVNVNSLNKDKMTPLHFAACKGHSEVAKVLIKFGAVIDAQDNRGFTPLHTALLNGMKPIVITLLENGADINIISRDSYTVLDCVLTSIATTRRRDWFSGDVIEGENDFSLSCIDTLRKHTIKMNVAKLNVSEKIVFPTDDSYKLFEYSCVKEMNNLKTEKIGNTQISYYDFLMKSVDQVAYFLTNECVAQSFDSFDYETRFPMYTSFIKSQICKGNIRKDLLEKICEKSSCVFQELPFDCISGVFHYLSNEDLKNLIQACQ